ncbi:hypothetical protein Tco_0281804 [Tanacetum coccineum]
MRTRNSNFPNNSNVTIPRRRNRGRAPNVVEPELRTIVEVAPMAERTMEELLRAPTEGYGEAIVLPEINADHFEIKTNLLQLVQANPFHGYERENPHAHINSFKRITSTLRFRDVPNDVIKLMMFPYSLEGAAKVCFRACPHHGFTELTQVDTFYNGLNENDQDSLNAAAGGNLLSKTTREALNIIENKSKVRYSRNKSNVSRMNTTSRESVSKTDERIDKLADQLSTLVEIVSKKVVTPAPGDSTEVYTVMSDSEDSTVTYIEVSSPFEGLSDIGSPGVVGPEYHRTTCLALRSQSRHHLYQTLFQSRFIWSSEGAKVTTPTRFYPRAGISGICHRRTRCFRLRKNYCLLCLTHSSEDDEDDDEVDIEADDDEEEEEHPAPCDSVCLLYQLLIRPICGGDTAFETMISSPVRCYSFTPLYSPIRPLGYQATMIRLRAEAASTSYSLLLPSPIILSHTIPAAPLSGTPPLHLLSTDRREDRPEVTLLPRKRLGIALGPAYKIGESSSLVAARLAGGLGADYGFVCHQVGDRRDLERDVGYGITDSWDEIVEAM